MTSTHFPTPPTADLRRLLDAELSLRSRLGYVALLLASAAMTAVIASLWLTEPTLPTRTAVAFAVLTLIGLSWIVFSGWVLTRRRPLFGRDGLVAGRMAVTFTAAFVVGRWRSAIRAAERLPMRRSPWDLCCSVSQWQRWCERDTTSRASRRDGKRSSASSELRCADEVKTPSPLVLRPTSHT